MILPPFRLLPSLLFVYDADDALVVDFIERMLLYGHTDEGGWLIRLVGAIKATSTWSFESSTDLNCPHLSKLSLYRKSSNCSLAVDNRSIRCVFRLIVYFPFHKVSGHIFKFTLMQFRNSTANFTPTAITR